MLILYNTLQLTIIILFFPLLLLYVGLKPKYRKKIPKKLGKSLIEDTLSLSKTKKTIWIHALSVGEVTSALPLISRLKQDFPNTNIVFSSTTKTGSELAEKSAHRYCDSIIVFPLDIIYVVKFFLDCIKPDLFILVETDFWPNFLHQLHCRNIPSILVNGRISRKSINSYRRFRFFCSPMFKTFSLLCVQTESDRIKLIELGAAKKNIYKLGNLKFEQTDHNDNSFLSVITGNSKNHIIVAGSTHPGEEESLLHGFRTLKKTHPIQMIIAPRQIERGDEIADIVKSFGFTVTTRSTTKKFDSDILILNSIGELCSLYSIAKICFVGGSLIDEGGHNPIEPAGYGKPVLFGPYMEDFEEISEELLQAGGAFRVTDIDELTQTIDKLLSNETFYNQCSNAARNCVNEKKGVLDNHIQLIGKFM